MSPSVAEASMPEPLTELERRILDYLVDYLQENTYQPSIREIGRRFNIKSTKTVSEHLQALADKGWIERDPSRSRGVRILGLDLRGTDRRAAAPIEVVDAGTHALMPESVRTAPSGSQFVAMAVAGAGDVRSGDTVLAQPVEEPSLTEGDLVAARRRGTATVARVRRNAESLTLEWADGSRSALRPQRAEGIEVVGRAIGLWRQFASSVANANPHPVAVQPKL